MKRFILALIVSVLICAASKAQVCHAATPAAADVQTAINNCSAGGTVTIPAGSATWASSGSTPAITMSQTGPIIIQGATLCSGAPASMTCGSDTSTTCASSTSTCITVNYASSFTFSWAGTPSTLLRITGITFIEGSSTNGNGAFALNGSITGPGFRFDHNHIIAGTGASAPMIFAQNYGLLDHNLFDEGGTFSHHMIECWGDSGGSGHRGFDSWARASTLGTSSELYIEDNRINASNQADDILDAYSGCREVLRHNEIHDASVGYHGTDSGSWRSVFSSEIYSNTFINNSSTSGLRMATSRGGTLLIFSNSYGGSTGYGNTTGLQNNRANGSGNTSDWGNCDGTNWELGSTDPSTTPGFTNSTNGGVYWNVPNRDTTTTTVTTGFFDGNPVGTGAAGYACRDNPGRTHNQVLAPDYEFLNTGTSGIGPVDSSSSVIIANQDYYAASSCATGSGTQTAGVCTGTLSARQTNCTAGPGGSSNGVGFWATDTSTLYVCNPTNTWTTYYAPYTYPHPLTPGASATPIVCPNNSQTGNSANCLQAPTLAFGNQGTSTASMAIPASINNCSTTNIPACTGTGSLTLASSSVFTLSGTNASDFSVSAGGCTAGLIIGTGASCSFTVTFTPTATAGTAETATLTVSYSGVSSSTMSLTGTSATVTTLSTSSCPTTLTGGTLYQLTANITCNGTAFQFSSNASMNLNGFTVTYNNTNQTTQTGAFLGTGFSNQITVYNGTISQGAGTNTWLTEPSTTIQAAITSLSGKNFQDGSVFANLTFNYSFQYWNAINVNGPNTNGGNAVIHDVTVNDTAIGTCNQPGCRNVLQSVPIVQPGTANNNGTHWYNITILGSAQGGLGSDAPGAIVEHNLVQIGSNSGSAGTNSNNFGIYCWGGCNAHDNLIMLPLLSYTSGRGLQMAADGGSGNKSSHNNVIQAYSLADSTEYSGCQIGGTYGIQFDDNPTGTNNVDSNTVNVFAKGCGASGLRITDSRVTTNTSTNSTYTATRQSGASTCSMGSEQDPQPGCAFGASINGNFSPQIEAFTSTSDTFTADTGIICLCQGAANASQVKFQSSTFNKGSNPSATWHTFWSTNGGPGQIYVIDASVGAGVSLTDTSIPAQSANEGPTSFYIQWTQTITVQNSGAVPIPGATVTYTDAQSNAPSCTTNSSGVCSVVVTQYRLNNDTGANQIENHNTQTRTVSSSGCNTSTTSGLTISSTNSATVTLSGCGVIAAPAVLFAQTQ